MLDFYPEPTPYDFLFDGMMAGTPGGSFYLQTDEMVAFSSKETNFVLITDTAAPVRFYINNVLVKTHIPRSKRDIVKLPMQGAPAVNHLLVDNGIDPPVNTSLAATHIAAVMRMAAAQLYQVAARTNQEYYNLLSSPWSAFLVEWLLPWTQQLPDVRTFRAMSVKMIGNTIYGESGLQGGVTDFTSAFCSSTPVQIQPVNPWVWQPHVVQPQTAGDDYSTTDQHVWYPNLCLRRYLAVLKVVRNVKSYSFRSAAEEGFIVQRIEHALVNGQSQLNLLERAEIFEQHLFDNLATECSFRGMLDAAGCMDNMILTGVMRFTAQPAWCGWANPFDMMVELPGIGGRFFDSSTLDTASHAVADTTNRVSDEPYVSEWTATNDEVIDLVTEIHGRFNAHDLDATPQWHYATGGAHQITAPIPPALPVDPPNLLVWCLDAQTQYLDHINDASMHDSDGTVWTLDVVLTGSSTLDDMVDFLNEMRNKLNEHLVHGNFDSRYDIDTLTDYWLGALTTKPLDSGGCFDAATQIAELAKDLACCHDGPDVSLFSTLRSETETTASVQPIHPLYGGDDPGLLANPYFGVLT